jgi:outer membrane protein assembly factor BamB/tetratricopeptide (TPR) repeat protein
MFVLRRAWLPPCLLALALAIAPSGPGKATAQGEPPPGAEGPAAPEKTTEPVGLPNDEWAQQGPIKLQAARDYAREKDWPEAVRLLQVILDREDRFRRDGEGKNVRWLSLRTEAERMLEALPAAGRDFYALSYEGPARRMLDEARDRHDLAGLHEVVRRFRSTTAGAEALALLGTHYLDRGHHDLAAACFAQLFRRPGPDKLPPLTLFKAALAFRGAGPSPEPAGHESLAWRHLSERIGEEGLRVGPTVVKLDQLRENADRWAGGEGGEVRLFRGDTRRTSQAAGASFLLEPLRSVSTAQGEALDWVRAALRSSPEPTLPGSVPLAVAGKLIFRGQAGLVALDADTGKEAWQTPSPLALETLLQDPGKKVQLQHWFNLYGPLRPLLLANTTTGTLSSDGRLVFCVEDLPLPPHPSLVQIQESGNAVRSFGPLRHAARHNRLRAVRLATGAVAWEVGGVDGEPPRSVKSAANKPASGKPAVGRPGRVPAPSSAVLREAFFLGPPLPLAGRLYALLDKDQELLLACLDAERGSLLWSQPLVLPQGKVIRDVIRRTRAAQLAYADGVLVCPTNAGAVLGVDPLTRTLLWMHVYRQRAAEEDGGNTDSPERASWHFAAPLVHEDSVILATPDADGLCCLRLSDGALRWRVNRTEDDLYLAGAWRDRVLLVGKTTCRALSLATGEMLWQQSSGRPAGQGVACGPLYYLPLADGAILALNVERPGDSARIGPAEASAKPGNLLFYRGTLWSQSAERLTAYSPLADRLAQAERRLAEAPHDPQALVERGTLRLDKGDVAGSAADLHAALAQSDTPRDLRVPARARLFTALTQLLGRDFAAGEKYLAEYRRLCEEAIAPAERRRRLTGYHALLAAGRGRQGRLAEALAAYRDLLEGAGTGQLMTVPDEPGVQVRPELWVQGRVAALYRQAREEQRRTFAEIIRREAEQLPSSDDPVALSRFVNLFGAVPAPAGAPAWEVRLRLARRWTEEPGRKHALEADLALDGLEQHAGPPEQAARALHLRAQLLTRAGCLDGAVDCFRRLASVYPKIALEDGRTGPDLLADLATDRRFLAHVEPPIRPWAGRRMVARDVPGGISLPPTLLPLFACRTTPRVERADSPFIMADGRPPEVPPACRRLQLRLDSRTMRLHAADRDTGKELFTVALPIKPVTTVPGESVIWYQAVDRLLVLLVGYRLVGVDLLDHRVRWMQNLLDGATVPLMPLGNGGTDGTLMVMQPGRSGQQVYGMMGPAGLSGVFVLTPRGLSALDPATGEVRWRRTDLPSALTVFGDGTHLFVGEPQPDGGLRSLRALRAADGGEVIIPDSVARYNHRLRVFGRRLLSQEEGPGETMVLHLHDLLTGKELWQRTFPAHSVPLESPLPHLFAVAAAGGEVTILDLRADSIGEASARFPKLTMERGHVEKGRSGWLLADSERWYVALHGTSELAVKGPVLDEGSPNFRGLSAIHVNGMLYAFGRSDGALRWYSPLPVQSILLEHFEDLPIILCSATMVRQTAGMGMGLGQDVETIAATRSLDKQTGKLLYNREGLAANETFFHALHIDPSTGAIDLVSAAGRVRHLPRQKKMEKARR